MDPKPPQERSLYRGFGNLMAAVGLGPIYWSWYEYPKLLKYYFQFQHLFTSYLAVVGFSSQLIFLYVNYSRLDKNTLSIVYSIIPIGWLALVKSTCSRTASYKKILVDFMEQIHLYNYYRMNRTETVKTKLIEVERATAIIGVSLSLFMFCDWFVWMLTPVLYNVRNIDAIINGTDNFRTCFYMWMPFDYLNNFNYYLIENFLNMYVTFLAILMIFGFDMINYVIIFNLIGHIQILKDNIRTRFLGEMSDDDTRRELIDIVKHHCFIIKTFEGVKHTFGVSIAANYLQNLVEDGLLMYQFMFGDKESVVTYGLTLLYYMGGLVIMSLVLEEIRRESEDLSEVLYCNIPWEHMSVPNQKTFIIILGNMTPVLEFVALGCFRAGIMPAISIIKTTFSYYVMIKSRM